jgi:hypothetical protein
LFGRGVGMGDRSLAGRNYRLRYQSACDLGPRIAHSLLPLGRKAGSG